MVKAKEKVQSLMSHTRFRLFLFIAVIVIVIAIAIIVIRSGSSTTSGGSAKVARISSQISSVPGSQKLSQQYLSTLLQSNQESAEQALRSGGSAIPTLIDTGYHYAIGSSLAAEGQLQGMSSCLAACQACCQKRTTASDILNQLVRNGQIAPVVAAQLNKLQEEGASVSDYANKLNELVQEGKITRAQANQLLAAYKGEHEAGAPTNANALIDAMQQSGAVSPQAASQLKQLSDSGASVGAYQTALDQMVRNGQLTQQQADQLLAAYRRQRGLPATPKADELVNQMASLGNITPDVANQLRDLTSRNVPASAYNEALQRLVSEGKLTPEQAQRLLAAYQVQKSGAEAVATGASTDSLLDGMQQSGSITPTVANELKQLSNSGASVGDYEDTLARLVKNGQLSPSEAKQLLAAYRAQHPTEEQQSTDATLNGMLNTGNITAATASQLRQLADNNVPLADYDANLQRLVQEGKLTPEQASRLLTAYKREHPVTETKASTDQLVDQMLQSGNIAPAVASQLKQLSAGGASVDAYKANLAQLVRDGKLTPEQAQKLLSSYQAEHGGTTEPTPDQLISQLQDGGNITAAVAQQLHRLSQSNASEGAYKAALDRLVSEGKLTPEQAQQLLESYKAQHAFGIPSPTNQLIQQMEKTGKLSPDTAAQLSQLAKSGISIGAYDSALRALVQQGKLTPEQAQQLLTSYRKEHLNAGEQLSANAAIDQMDLPADVKQQLKQLGATNITPGDYAAALNKMVSDGKISAEQAEQLLRIYRRDHPAQTVAGQASTKETMANLEADGKISPQTAEQLNNLSASGASTLTYARDLNRLVDSGQLTPGAAQMLLTAYRTENGDTSVPPGAKSTIDRLERAQQREALSQQMSLLNQKQQEYQQKQAAAAQQRQLTLAQKMAGEAEAADTAQQRAILQYVTAINTQATDLIQSWNVVPQKVEGKSEKPADKDKKSAADKGKSSSKSGGTTEPAGFPLVKAGTIMFAVLDTSVNSDQPGPVMATMVSGKLKGAKLLGSLSQTPDGERVMLSFTSLTKDDWPITIPINAVAINPDTARTAIASDVNHHYLLRFGSLFAANFIQGYAQAIQQAGQTQVNNSGATTTTNPNLTPKEKLFVGLGQVGQKLSQLAQQWVDKKPTVLVDAGVGLGILFTKDVAQPKFK